MSDISKLIKLVSIDLKKSFKKDAPEIKLASEVNPAYGMILDNPALEFIFDRRFIAYGRCYLVYGNKGCSKTTLVLDIIKAAQQQGGYGIMAETEKALDLDYIKAQGVDMDKLILPEVDSLSQALMAVLSSVRNLSQSDVDSSVPIVVVLDSIASGVTDYELEDGVQAGATKVGDHAKLLSWFYRKLVAPLSYENIIFIATNQTKTDIMKSFGDKDTQIGGKAPGYHSTGQFKVVRVADLTQSDEEGALRKVGSVHEITCQRNKLGREGKTQKIRYSVYAKGGIDWYSDLVEKLGKEYSRLVDATGAGYYRWNIEGCKYTYKDEEGKDAEALIDVNKRMRKAELGYLISQSHDAKEEIRKAFGIPDLPAPEILEKIKKENSKRRKTLVKDDSDISEAIKEEPVD